MSKSIAPNSPRMSSQTNLLRAFELFQIQSERLENSHAELKERFIDAQKRLARTNEELADRIHEIQEIKEQLTGILESIGDAVMLVDSTGHVKLANHSASALGGYDSDRRCFTGDWPELDKVIHSVESVTNIDIPYRANGDERNYLVSLIPMTTNKNNRCLKVLSLKDVTDHRRLQQRVAREDRLAALGQVAANVAHEIRNPLCGIEGFATLLERDLADDRQLQRLAMNIKYGTRQLNAVVSNLLSYSREMPTRLVRHPVVSVISDAVTSVQPLADDRKIKMIPNFPDTALMAKIDVVQLRQVIVNLLVNALDACCDNHDGRLEIRAGQGEDNIKIDIEDNGCGIPDNVRSRIFEPFFTTKDGGIGLGLALCKRIIEIHDGILSCKSTHGTGTTFTLILKQARE